MKQTVTVNLSGKVFNIDVDAYSLLNSYLKNLEAFFAKDSGKNEIIEDFESRMQELLSAEKPNLTDVVTISDVEKLIKTIGNPNDFNIDSTSDSENGSSKNYSSTETKSKSTRKLYRNPNDKIVGGVCSGVAAFFKLDVTLIRIATILLAFFSVGTVFLIYLILWIIVPVAKTAQQQLEMCGEDVNVENIGKVLSANAQDFAEDIKTAYHKVNNKGCVSNLLRFLLIGFGVLILIPLIFILILFVFVLFAVVLGFFTTFYSSIALFSTVTIGLFIGIPLLGLIYSITSTIFKWKPLHKSIKITSLIVWLISLGSMAFIATKVDWRNINISENEVKSWVFNNFHYVKGDGNIKDKTLVFEHSVNALQINSPLNFKVIEDSTITDNIAIIQTDSNILEKLNIYQESKLLTINRKRNCHLEPSNNVIIIKVKKNIWENVELSGSTNVRFVGKWIAKRINLELSGSSEIEADRIEADDMTFEISGSSDVSLNGNIKYAYYDVSGASTINNRYLVADSVKLDISGASNVEISSKNYIGGDLSGASSVIYFSEPQKIDVDKSGAASIIKDRELE